MYCAAHPRVETLLKCGKCDRPICLKCNIVTIVGSRCPACAGLRSPIATLRIAAKTYAMGLVAGIGIGLGLGVLLGLSSLPAPRNFSWIILVVGLLMAGYIIGEIINSIGTVETKKAFRALAFGSILMVYIGFEAATPYFAPKDLYTIAAVIVGGALAVSRVR